MANQLVLAVANALMVREVEQLKKRVEREPSACQLKQRCAPHINLLAHALWDMSGRVLNANDAYLELVGSTSDELLRGQLSWNDLTPARYADRDRRALEEIKNSGRCVPFEKEIWRRDGLCIPVLVHAAAVDDAGSCIISYMVDLRGRSLAGSSPSVGAAPCKQLPSIIVADRKTQELRQLVEKVAPTDATVLIQGETGTGKEVFAQLVHQLSPRRDQPFIKVNCAAIPSGLLESELFGHEKGAFTGAAGRKVGRIELADGGTLFLDEIGDLPLELQPKLLRVLQEQQFERLGGTKIREVDIRLIAATNQDLTSMVGQGRFRSDLFYRLNVFRLTVPPLRERKESIPTLVEYFIDRSSAKFGRKIRRARPEAMLRLQGWHWPGNVRELENLIERAMIMASGEELDVSPADLVCDTAATAPTTTLRDVEREHILRVFRECGGIIAGTRGAAARLAVKRTTLQYKMKKLGISRQNL
jgi:PAS domain S-box-containing protein